MTPVRDPETKRLDLKIMRLWNQGKKAKEIKALLGLDNVWRVHNVRKRFPAMRRARLCRT